ncbi:hypothetical protein [Roseofilum casamattae]|uniref:Uncharacterized protein n=1 Tax=Roseofilum casamattae BLCC-M143 TaxID=3022442 RepID=A0ABT7BYW7_9CYAN|nr:hypothetical protein [Roseofilum casamattae]MDJ1184351.1 hypothetical protein [Roseofilum casamattae BLCC-M143]
MHGKEGLLKPWEFLIQKEGDRAWLPLEPPSVEVLEGRYQLVVRSQFPQVPIAVTLTYQSDSEGTPQVQARDRQTNKEGLMVVFPYTHLKAGWWNITCNLQSEDGESRSYIVALKALSVDAEEDEFDDDGNASEEEKQDSAIGGSAIDGSAIGGSAIADLETSPVEEEIEEEIEPEDLDESEEEDNPEEPEEPEAYDSSFFDVPPPPEAPEPFPYLAEVDLSSVEFALDRQMVLAGEDGDVLLNGMLSGDRPEVFPGQVGLKLVVSLYDPQNLELIQQLEHLLILQSVPVPFAYRFPLPEENTLHFILAEAKIFDSWSVTPEPEGEEPQPLTAVQFSISTGIDRLMEEIAERRESEDVSSPAPPIVPFPLTAEPAHFPSAPVSKPPAVNLDLFNIAKKQPKASLEFTQPFQISASPSIPPQLASAEVTPARKYLQLPSLNGLSAAAPSEDLPRLPEAPKPPEPKQELTLPPVNLTPVAPAAPEPEPEPETPPSPIDEAFQSLHLQDKFAERLNELAKEAEAWVDEKLSVEEGEESAELAEQKTDENENAEDEVLDAEFVEDESPAILELETVSEPLKLLPPGEDEERKAQEVVWDGGSRQEETVPESRSLVPSKLQHFDVPLPTPEVESLETDWVAGETIAIEIGLAARSPNIHVKYWLLDTQTRMLLQEPGWIVDFLPEGLDDRRAILQLVVPNGTMEVQFEAIAVEVGTQRESHKASFRRLVIPPNLPELTFEELEE